MVLPISKFIINKGRRKKTNRCGHVHKRGGGGSICPPPISFFQGENDAECSETEKYVF